LAGATVLCVGLAYIASSTGKVLLLVGAVILIASLAGFMKIKPLEGDTPVLPSPEAMKWIGAGVAALGWVVTLGGLHFVDGNSGRIIVALLGIGVSLFGILYVLPATFNKAAFWKKPAGTSARAGLTTMTGKATAEPAFSAASRAVGGAK
jgi:hypothetical protein